MEQIFNRSLLAIPDVKLWSLYVSYIRRRNSMTTGDVNKSYKIISDSFNFAINNVGMDKDSGRLWQDYIDFIKSGPGDIRVQAGKIHKKWMPCEQRTKRQYPYRRQP